MPQPYGMLFTVMVDYPLPTGGVIDAVRIDEPDFSGVIVGFNEVRLSESDSKEARLSYEYEILSGSVPPSKKVDFEIVLGNTIYDILLESLETQ